MVQRPKVFNKMKNVNIHLTTDVVQLFQIAITGQDVNINARVKLYCNHHNE